MGESYTAKVNISMNNSEEIDLQNYVDSVKQNKMTWNVFECLMKDFIYSDINRLTYINAILLTELTTNFSDIDRLKYLNLLLLLQFKEFIQKEDDFENTENEYLDGPQISMIPHDNDLDDKTFKEESEIQTLELIEVEESPTKKETIEPKEVQIQQVTKTFDCHICNKNYTIYFHLKQHIRKVHEKIQNTYFSKEYDLNTDNDSYHEGENQLN